MTPTHAPAIPGTHAHEHTDGHGTRQGYVIGFVLSVILTAIPFWLVMTDALHNPQSTALVILAFAAVQIAVHVVFFLHLTTRAEGGWTLIAFVFTLVIVGIVVSGSVWIMYHLNTNLMPPMPPMMENH